MVPWAKLPGEERPRNQLKSYGMVTNPMQL